ncbi:hypothetical protein PP178_01765 [Zeaxanthinibacter sp. PT1]|nr:hypothetical protein [Zeaxanthinibacter sp. PT1]MDC6350263.1 hypothetical protein [Zeaxanthinibacter sp. PT1]
MSDDNENLIEQKKKQSLEERAIDESATHGKEINHQVKDKKNHHQPRDTA